MCVKYFIIVLTINITVIKGKNGINIDEIKQY